MSQYLFGGSRRNLPQSTAAAPPAAIAPSVSIAETAPTTYNRSDSSFRRGTTPSITESPGTKKATATAFIFVIEFCERFSFYGIREVLMAFLMDELDHSKSSATSMVNTFTFFHFVFPFVGALLGDSFIGKYRAIVYLTVCCGVGTVMLAISGSLALPITGVVVMSVASAGGGIKPCIAAFGGDQFELPNDDKLLRTFYCWLHTSVNVAALFAIIFLSYVDPAVVFWMCAIMIWLMLAVFVGGKYTYKRIIPVKHALEISIKCILYALVRRCSTRERKGHWLDYAADKYSEEQINDVKESLRVLCALLPVPVFWGLYYQMFTAWKTLAERTNLFVNGRLIRLEHVNPICVILLVPLFKYAIYPLCDVVNLLQKPAHRMIIGGLFVSVSFMMAYNAAERIEEEGSPMGRWWVDMKPGYGYVWTYNNMECEAKVALHLFTLPNGTSLLYRTGDIPSYRKQIGKDIELPATSNEETYFMPVNISSCHHPKISDKEFNFNMTIYSNLMSVLVVQYFPIVFPEYFKRNIEGYPLVRVLIQADVDGRKVHFECTAVNALTVVSSVLHPNQTLFTLASPGVYDVRLDEHEEVLTSIDFQPRSISYVMVNLFEKKAKDMIRHEVVMPNDRFDFWLLVPQYVVLAIGEVMFVISGMEFVYANGPGALKCTLQAFWLLTVALGILLTISFEYCMIEDDKMSYYFLVCAIAMVVDIGVFALLAFLLEFL